MTVTESTLSQIVTYTEVVMIQGEEGRFFADLLYNVEGVVAHGATAESIATVAALLQGHETGDEPVYSADEVPVPWGTSDDVFRQGEYVLSANLGLGYVALAHVIEEK